MNIALTGAAGFIGKILRAELEKAGHKVYPCRTDDERFLPYTGEGCLIHCARHHENITGEITESKWQGEFETDVMLPYFYTMNMVRANPKLNNIIFISSIYGIKVPTVRLIPVNYQVCKAAEIQLSKILAVNLAPKIRVNTVILGGVLSDREVAEQTPEFRRAYETKTLLGHMVLPEEVAGAVKFLVSGESKGMTGASIVIDGGYTIC